MKSTSKCKKCGVKTILIKGKTFEDALMNFRREIAFEGLEALRKKNKFYLSTEELIAAKYYGRK